MIEKWLRQKEFDRDKAVESALATFRKNGFGATTTEDLRLAMGASDVRAFTILLRGRGKSTLEALRKYNSDRVLGFFRDLQEVWISS